MHKALLILGIAVAGLAGACSNSNSSDSGESDITDTTGVDTSDVSACSGTGSSTYQIKQGTCSLMIPAGQSAQLDFFAAGNLTLENTGDSAACDVVDGPTVAAGESVTVGAYSEGDQVDVEAPDGVCDLVVDLDNP